MNLLIYDKVTPLVNILQLSRSGRWKNCQGPHNKYFRLSELHVVFIAYSSLKMYKPFLAGSRAGTDTGQLWPTVCSWLTPDLERGCPVELPML